MGTDKREGVIHSAAEMQTHVPHASPSADLKLGLVSTVRLDIASLIYFMNHCYIYFFEMSVVPSIPSF